MTAIQVFKKKNGKYKFDVKAFKKILNSSGDNLVAIYSMNGPLRLGKSFMLGFFLRYLQNKGNGDWISKELQNTFKYKGGSVRETTGIWIWSEPYVVEKNGQKISVFLMDTQGCFDQETTMQENAMVFALSTLLSSVMIFNIKRQISEDNLQFLQYFAGFARLADNDKYDEPFQRLIFLIRDWEFQDFPLGYYDDKTSINGKNYKKTALDVREDQPIQVKCVHESILNTFENISFYLMPHPGKEVAMKSNFDIAKVDEDFLEHLDLFVHKVLEKSKIIPKKIGGVYVTGNQFIKYAEEWAEMFEADALPEVKSIFDATAEIQNEMAKSAAIDYYSQKINENLKSSQQMTENDFKSFHSKLMEECVKLFKSYKRLGGPKIEKKYLSLISEQTNKSYETFNETNNIKINAKESQQKYEIERTRIENEMKDCETKLKEMSAENKEEKDRMLKELKEKEKEKEQKAKELAELQLNVSSKQKENIIQVATEMTRMTGNLFGMLASQRQYSPTNAPDHHSRNAPAYPFSTAPHHHSRNAPEYPLSTAPHHHSRNAPEYPLSTAPELPFKNGPEHHSRNAPEYPLRAAPELPFKNGPEHHSKSTMEHLTTSTEMRGKTENLFGKSAFSTYHFPTNGAKDNSRSAPEHVRTGILAQHAINGLKQEDLLDSHNRPKDKNNGCQTQ